MKEGLTLLFTRVCLAICALSPVWVSGQTQNCTFPAGAGGTISPAGSVALIGSLSPNLNRTGESTGLDLIQYVFTNPNDLVFDDFSNKTGPRIILANDNGRVDAGADLGLERGDEFCVFSWSFSLSILQRQVDTLYNSEFLEIPCCLFAEATQGVDVCSLLASSGIIEGTDLEDFNDIVDFAVAYGIQPTFASISFLVDSFINVVPPGSPCTAGSPMCYATSNTSCFTVDTGTSTGFTQLLQAPGISQWQAGPNPVQNMFQISFLSQYNGPLEMEVTDMTGRLVLRQKEAIFNGKNQFELDFSGLAPGYHMVRLITPEWTTATRALVE